MLRRRRNFAAEGFGLCGNRRRSAGELGKFGLDRTAALAQNGTLPGRAVGAPAPRPHFEGDRRLARTPGLAFTGRAVDRIARLGLFAAQLGHDRARCIERIARRPGFGQRRQLAGRIGDLRLHFGELGGEPARAIGGGSEPGPGDQRPMG